MSDYIKRENALDIVAHNNVNGEITLNRYDKIIDGIYEIPSAEVAPVVRCKDCKWYDPPHIDHGDGKRTDVEDDAPFVPLSVGINVGGKCMNTLREYCCNHDREDPDDYERLVKFRNRMDFCSDGERKGDE